MKQEECGLHSLRVSGRADPLGVPSRSHRLSWSVSPDADIDTSRGFDVFVASGGDALNEGAGATWKAHCARPWIVYSGPAPAARQRLYWQVAGYDAAGHPVRSATASFEAGLPAADDWSAIWVAAPELQFARESWDPCPYLRNEFDLDVTGTSRLYITALGLYRVWLNGAELTANALFRPGWTDYDVRVHHQTFDCSNLLLRGRNVLAVVLAKGWYAGRLGLLREPGFWGQRPALLAQLEVGGSVVAATDVTWKAGYGALQASDLIRGEVQDMRQEPSGWQRAGFDDGSWPTAEAAAIPGCVVEPQPHDSIARFHVHQGVLVHEHARGPAVFDFGQNLVGWTKLTTRCLPKVELTLRHGEILTSDNLVYRDNLRGAFQEDTYVVSDEGPHELQTSFTMHGFRFAEVWGLPSQNPHGNLKLLPDTSIEAISITGLLSEVGKFECSNARLTQLASNVAWTVRDNFLEVATDCPQRDERQGWLADASVIAPSAAYHFDVSAFLAKFTQDAADAQGPDGEIPDYAPALPAARLRPGAPGWSDGLIRLVHLLVQRYGDLPVAERLFGAMARFLDHVDRANPDGLRVNAIGASFGDWLSLPEREGLQLHAGYAYTGAYSTTPLPIVNTAHTYRSLVQLSQIAAWLGDDIEATRLASRAERVREAYRDAFVLPDGRIKDATQTAYAQAVGFGLLQGDDARVAVAHLSASIERTGQLTTGIHGVEHVLPVLCQHGHSRLALEMLQRQECPSWLYMVGAGATTIWEKWDGMRPNGTLATAEMNSFNHCALGAVGRFLFEGVAGLDATTTTWTGEVHVRPQYDASLDWARASYDSPVGLIASAWRRSGDVVEHDLTIPGTAQAIVHTPSGARLEISGKSTPPGGELRLGKGLHTVRVHGLPRS